MKVIHFTENPIWFKFIDKDNKPSGLTIRCKGHKNDRPKDTKKVSKKEAIKIFMAINTGVSESVARWNIEDNPCPICLK